jgi:hypothetical protein
VHGQRSIHSESFVCNIGMATTSPIQTWILGDNAVANERLQRLLVEQSKVEKQNTLLFRRIEFFEKVK